MVRGQATPIHMAEPNGPKSVRPGGQVYDMRSLRSHPDKIFSLRCIRTGTRQKSRAIGFFHKDDMCDPKAVFSELSILRAPKAHQEDMVELVGIEPTTPCLQSRCSPS